MPRLFWKIFGWFWGAMILIGLALYTVVLTTRPDPMPPEWRRNTTSALRVTAALMVSEWERGGAAALRTAQRNAQRGENGRFRLLDGKGERLFPNRNPAVEREAAPNANERPSNERPNNDRPNTDRPNIERPERENEGRRNPNFGPLENSRYFNSDAVTDARSRFRQMINTASKSEQPVFDLVGTRAVVAVRETSESGKNYILLADLPRPASGRPAAAARTQLVGGVVALLLSGLVCWGLVRYLTAPLIALRGATQQLAAGDLAARTGANKSRRQDEVADLGRDFDVMAARIENLVEGQRQLLGDISHELRSPLARLRMAGALGRRQIENGAAGDEFMPAFERITRETARLDLLIGQLLDLTRLENGGRGEREPVAVAALIEEIVADAQFEASACNKRVEITRADAFSMNGERELLRSAIENVVRNALRHTPENERVEIALTASDVGALVRVRDHGTGVPDETLERIFEPFFPRRRSARPPERRRRIGSGDCAARHRRARRHSARA